MVDDARPTRVEAGFELEPAGVPHVAAGADRDHGRVLQHLRGVRLEKRRHRQRRRQVPDLPGEHDQVVLRAGQRHRLHRRRDLEHRLGHHVEELPDRPGKRVRGDGLRVVDVDLDLARRAQGREQHVGAAAQLARLAVADEEDALHADFLTVSAPTTPSRVAVKE